MKNVRTDANSKLNLDLTWVCGGVQVLAGNHDATGLQLTKLHSPKQTHYTPWCEENKLLASIKKYVEIVNF